MENNSFTYVWNKAAQNNPVYREAELISNLIRICIETRVKKGLNQQQLADMCGMKQSAIARIESMNSMPRIDTMARILTSLNIDVEYVVNNAKNKLLEFRPLQKGSNEVDMKTDDSGHSLANAC